MISQRKIDSRNRLVVTVSFTSKVAEKQTEMCLHAHGDVHVSRSFRHFVDKLRASRKNAWPMNHSCAPITPVGPSNYFLLRGDIVKSKSKTHCLYVKWGDLQVGAFGLPAVATVLSIVFMGFFGRLLGLW